MALYHLHMKIGCKAKGQSAAAAYSYVMREGKYARKRADLVASGSGNMPPWASGALEGDAVHWTAAEAYERAQKGVAGYWTAADTHERANGRLFRSIEVALPTELPTIDQIKLVEQFCKDTCNTKDGPLPYSYAIHLDPAGRNPHAHIMLSERVNDHVERTAETWFKRAGKTPDQGGARKTDLLNSKDWLISTRAHWAKITNSALEEVGSSEFIDYRSYAERGIGIHPTPHIGPSASKTKKTSRKFKEWQEASKDRIVEIPPNPIITNFLTHMEEREDMNNLTRNAIKRQLDAMDCEKYTIGIQNPEKGMLQRTWTKEEILDPKNLAFLAAKNAAGENIYIRPESQEEALILVDDLPREKIDSLMENEPTPACVVETSPNNFQAWFRLQKEKLAAAIKKPLLKIFTKRLQGDPASATIDHFGRLAGFTNRKPKYKDDEGKFPYVLCIANGSKGDMVDQSFVKKAVKFVEQCLKEQDQQTKQEQEIQMQIPEKVRSAEHAISVFEDYIKTSKRIARDAHKEIDESALDFGAVCHMFRKEWEPDQVLYALRHASPDLENRKGAGADQYCILTVQKAWQEIEPELLAAAAEEEDEDGDSPAVRPGR